MHSDVTIVKTHERLRMLRHWADDLRLRAAEPPNGMSCAAAPSPGPQGRAGETALPLTHMPCRDTDQTRAERAGAGV